MSFFNSKSIDIIEGYSDDKVQGMLQFVIKDVDEANKVVYGSDIHIWVNSKYWFRKNSIIAHEMMHIDKCLFHNRHFDSKSKLGRSDLCLKLLIELHLNKEINYNDKWILKPYENLQTKHHL